jgi:hypothetical protein
MEKQPMHIFESGRTGSVDAPKAARGCYGEGEYCSLSTYVSTPFVTISVDTKRDVFVSPALTGFRGSALARHTVYECRKESMEIVARWGPTGRMNRRYHGPDGDA